MARKARNYQREYERRIELGRIRGETRAEARGHRAEGRRRVGTSRELTPRQLPSYLDKLAERRNVKVVAYGEDGMPHVVGRGHPRAMAAWFREQLAEGAIMVGGGPVGGPQEAEMIRVFFE